jgi:BASS family bile acid:Na+ symporter
METETLISILVPLGLALIMWGLGLNLSKDDFVRVRLRPKVITVALLIQIVLVPVFAALLCWLFQLPMALAIGLMLLASTPGGATANVFSFLAKGNVALNITLTAINSIIGIFFVPLMLALCFKFYAQSGTAIPLQTSKLIQVVLVLLVPLLVGFAMNLRNPTLAARFEKFVTRFSVVFLVLLLVIGVSNEMELIRTGIAEIGLAVLLFNLGSMAFGFMGAWALRLDRADTTAIVMELGIHNCALALAIAMSPMLLNNMQMAVPAALYIVIMYITAGILTLILRKSSAAKA